MIVAPREGGTVTIPGEPRDREIRRVRGDQVAVYAGGPDERLRWLKPGDYVVRPEPHAVAQLRRVPDYPEADREWAWSVRCEDHGEQESAEDEADAKRRADDVGDWCRGCQRQIAAWLAVPGVVPVSDADGDRLRELEQQQRDEDAERDEEARRTRPRQPYQR